jgi:hypothetical protein
LPKLGKKLNFMKGKILISGVFAMAIAFSSILGMGSINSASADTLSIPPCTNVNYGPFGNCMNGIRTRDVIGMYPFYCTLTSNELAGRSQVCGQVLGLKIYSAGVLLRSTQGKIYAVLPGNVIKLVPDVKALQAYRGEPVYNVSDELIAQYKQISGQVLGVKVYANGSLIRTPNNKVYVITNGQAKYLSSLAQLQQYKGRNIFNVNYDVLAKYSQVSSQVLGVKIYANGSLLRTPDNKIYVIQSGKPQYIRSLDELYQYRNIRIIDVSYAVLANI